MSNDKISGLTLTVPMIGEEKTLDVYRAGPDRTENYPLVNDQLLAAARLSLAHRQLSADTDFYPITGMSDTVIAPLESAQMFSPNGVNPYNDSAAIADFMIAPQEPGEKYYTSGLTAFGLTSAIDGPKKEDEYVLGTPAGPVIKALLTDGGLTVPEVEEHLHNHFFLKRSWCEKDKNWLQFLPYIVFYKYVEGRLKIFVYQRGKGVGEERLAGNYSIGVGGHVNPQDMFDVLTPSRRYSRFTKETVFLKHYLWNTIQRNMVREIDEEIEIFDTKKGEVIFLADMPKFTGMGSPWYMSSGPLRRMAMFLDYSASDVEKVHLGLFMAIEVPEHFNIRTSEEELVDVGFMDAQEIYDNLDHYFHAPEASPKAFELWTQSIIKSVVETQTFVQKHKDKLVEIEQGEDEKPLMVFEFDTIARNVPRQDRWKIGTLSRIFSSDLDFYETNIFMKV